jgi:hypothetical protein
VGQPIVVIRVSWAKSEIDYAILLKQISNYWEYSPKERKGLGNIKSHFKYSGNTIQLIDITARLKKLIYRELY